MSARELTILTVCFGSAPWIELNQSLYQEKNPDLPASWIVVENDASPCGNGKSFTRIPGPPSFPAGPSSASLHHAAGIRAGIKDVRSRFLLVLDPDFFPMMPEWAGKSIEHMKAHELAAFGTRWESGDFTKPKGFPSPHFCLIDTERLPLAFLDFSPDPVATELSRPWKTALDRFSEVSGKRRLTQWLRRRLLSGSSHDTGVRLAKQFRQAPDLKIEFLDVVRSEDAGTPEYDSIFWGESPFALHLRQVRARDRGPGWTEASGRNLVEKMAENRGGNSPSGGRNRVDRPILL